MVEWLSGCVFVIRITALRDNSNHLNNKSSKSRLKSTHGKMVFGKQERQNNATTATKIKNNGLDNTQRETTQHSSNNSSTAQHSSAQHTAQHSTAQHSSAQHSTAQHSSAQHSTAQHSTTQHNTAQHSTAQKATRWKRWVEATLPLFPASKKSTHANVQLMYGGSQNG